MPDVTFDGETVTATTGYLHNSQGRLIVATGRQNASNGPPDPKTFPPPPPPNATAVRSYQQRYCYDAIGNLLAVQQLANNAGWTREYAYHTETNADGKVVTFDSRLLATTVGLDTRTYAHDAAGNLTGLGDGQGGRYSPFVPFCGHATSQRLPMRYPRMIRAALSGPRLARLAPPPSSRRPSAQRACVPPSASAQRLPDPAPMLVRQTPATAATLAESRGVSPGRQKSA